MGVRISVVTIAVSLAVASIVNPLVSREVGACVLDSRGDLSDAPYAEMVVVGEVIAEQAGVPDPYQGTAYRSTVRVAAVLKGEPVSTLVLSGLGFLNQDCSGGPRLTERERVLILVQTRSDGALNVMSHDHGKLLLLGGFATNPYADPVPAEDAVRRIAAIVGTPAEEVEKALAFARGEDVPANEDEPAPAAASEDDDGAPWLVIGAAGAAALVLAAGAGYVVSHRRQN